jgi:hypothetical protein
VSFKVRTRGALLLVFLLAATLAAPQSEERNRMDVPPTTIFKSLLRLAAEQDQTKMERALGFLKPVLTEHRAAFGAASVEGLTHRITAGDAQTSAQAIRTLIGHDVVLLLRAAAAAPPARARTVVLVAAVEWRIVEDGLTQAGSADSAAARKISERLQDVVAVIDGKNADAGTLTRLSERLERDVTALFP